MNFNMPAVIKSPQAIVHITAGEVQDSSTSHPVGAPADQKFRYFLGDANIWVSNVSPHFGHSVGDTGGVGFVLHVDWHSPLNVGITITVEDKPPFEIQN
jgi:hypothetical protein